jgi:hypothetical protein
LPASIATVAEIPSEPTTAGPNDGAQTPITDWARVVIRAESLDWIPALIASLDRPFVIEHPEFLRQRVHGLARRLDACADAS